jgi:acid phosphatase family membrane protein YuiD
MTLHEATASVLLSVGIGEALKLGRQLLRKEPVLIFPLGGFVSSHSAAVSSLFLATYFEMGFSLLLLICAVFGAIVLRDAFGIRWQVSRHSLALNKLTRSKDFHITGHQKAEVFIGIALGVVVTLLVYWIM